MAGHVTCPLPELADALHPYIRTREETSHIRGVLSSNLLRLSSGQKLSRYTSARDTDIDDDLVIDGAEDHGVRFRYAKAAAAHRIASQRLAHLRLKLAEDGVQKVPEGSESQLDEVLLALRHLRNEQRKRRLLILENAVESIEHEKEQSPFGRVSHIINSDKQILPPPPPPPIIPTTHNVAAQDADITVLKKAVILAKSQADTDTSILDDGASFQWLDNEDPKCAMAAALYHTRDEMVRWFEGELSRIPEHDQQHDGAIDTVTTESTSDDRQLNEELVSHAYADYVDARRALVHAVAIMRDENGKTSMAPSGEQIKTNLRAEPAAERFQQSAVSSTPAAEVLPYAKSLYDIAIQESALLQETTFLRRQLVWNADKTNQLLLRLADESHLVAPGAKDVLAWAEAGEHVRDEDARNVHAKLLAGEQNLREAQTSVSA